MNSNLINCPDCQNQVSKDAATCPKCGKSFKTTPINLLATILLAIGGLVFVFYILGSV